ncbi:MAG TPA: right-handed parallel beta-helix repeat-containing protein [Candidatus Binatia bacterium]
MSRVLILALALAATATPPRPGRAAVSDPLCGSVPTQSLRLTHDVACDNNGIKAGADGITIDLGGFTLTGAGTVDSIGVDADGHTGVTVKNGTISGFWVGVSSGANFAVAPKMKLSHLTSRDNLTHGGAVETTAVVIDGCTFVANAFDGLLLTSQGGKVGRSLFTNSGGIGLIVSGSHLALTQIAATVNTGGGIRYVSASGVTVSASTIAGNTGYGVLFDGVDGNTLTKSTVIGNGQDGVQVIGQLTSGGNTIDKSLIAGNADGLVILDGPSATRVTGNRLIGNGGDGLNVDAVSSGTIVSGNTALGNGETGLEIQSATTTLTKNVVNANHAGIDVTAGAIDGGQNMARANVPTLDQCPAPIVCPSPFTFKPGGVTPTCELHVTSSIQLGEDTSVCATGGLIVDADGITIDLNNDRVRGDRSAGHVGIDVQGHTGVTIKNGVVSGFETGISSTGSGLKLQDVLVRENTGYGALVAGDHASVSDSAFIDNGGAGLHIAGTKPKVTSSYFVGNAGAGVVAEGDGGSFSNLTLALNDASGFVLGDIGKGQLKNAIAAGNDAAGVSIIAAPTSSLTVAKSLSVGNDGEGYSVSTQATRVTLTGNTAGGNFNVGLSIAMSNAAFTVTKNAAVGNSGTGMFFSESETISASGNTALGNRGDGIATDAATIMLAKSAADANLENGINPLPPGIADGGGNEAHGNVQGQCLPPIVCK